MKAAKHLLDELSKCGAAACYFRHRFPYLFVFVVDALFEGLDEEARLSQLAKKIGWTREEVEETARNANLELRLLTPAEQDREARISERGQSWLREVVAAPGLPPAPAARDHALTILHGYGYKGGQARSTCLGFLARALANDGWRVLVIDVDIEAPSLDVLFDKRGFTPESTLVGINAGCDVQPRRVFDPDVGSGHVDLIACRPDGGDFLLESVAMAMGFAMDPAQIERCARRIVMHAKEAGYDVLLLDHRAGLSPFVIPWLEAVPGQLVLFARLDDQWRAARDFLPALLRRSTERAAFVAFRSDGESAESFHERTKVQVEDLLSELAQVVNQSTDPPGNNGPGDLRPQFLIWPFDSAFRQERLPDPTRTSGDLRDVTYELRRITGVEGQRKRRGLSQSGAQDSGDFVQPPLWRELLSQSTPIRYIFGRKGTGKTRLLTEMRMKKLGEPLLVDRQDDSSFGLRSGSPVLNAAVERFGLGYEAFFWMLFGCALSLPDASRAALEGRVQQAIDQGTDLKLNMERLREQVGRGPRRTFLIDGLESTFPSDKVSKFIEALFRVLWAIQGDRLMQGQIEFRVFLRTDLASFGIQNREQQMEGQTAHLRWDYQAVLNFTLLRMLATEPESARFYASKWPSTVESIKAKRELLLRGGLSIQDAESLLLEIFPRKIESEGTLTTTFLRTFFTDSDTPALSRSTNARDGNATYYPRVFDTFLAEIAKRAQRDNAVSLDDEGRIVSDILLQGHEEAAKLFLGQLVQELDFRLTLSTDEEQNRRDIRRLLRAFHGERTPFVPAELAKSISSKLADALTTPKVQEALDQMLEIGMFEARPGHATEWQVGRLFRSSLQMQQHHAPTS